jgi:feruloyl esterase
VKDGVIENPKQCKFDPQVLQCKAGDAGGLPDRRSSSNGKEHLWTGHQQPNEAVDRRRILPGSELNWNTMAGPQPFGPGLDLFKYIVFSDPNWDSRL